MIRTAVKPGAFALFVLCLLCLTGLDAAAAGPLRVVSSSDGRIELAVEPQALQSTTVTTAAGGFTALAIPDNGLTDAIGAPALPVLRALLEVPEGASWSVTLENAVLREEKVAFPVLPLQPPRPKSGPEPLFALDPAAYGLAGFGDAPTASIEEAGYLRGHRLVQVTVRPVAYDPAGARLRVLESGRIVVNLMGADRAATERLRARTASPAFDQVMARAILNGSYARFNPGAEIGYLVISAPVFSGDANLIRLLDWKTRRGLHVTHVTTDQTGATKEQIKAYIQNAYDTWPIPPTFVLLVGDSDRIPNWVGIGADSPATDLNYTMLAGSDYLPDIQLGRFAIADATDLANVVNKTLNVERVEWSGNDDWEKHATFMASEDNYTVSEGTHNYVISTYLQPLGYTSDKLYTHTYGATTQQVRDAFNAGRSQGTYSGHGAETYWADGPVFYQSDVNALVNTVYPLVQSYSCLTGKFSTSECFGETWIRATHGGFAFFGSSVTSYWTEDDILEKRVYQGFYDDQNPGAVDQTWIGGMVVYGKLKYYDYFGNISMTRRYFEMYNILGDPSVDVWTAVPVASTVTAPTSLLAGQTSFAVTVTATPNAMVSARKIDGGNTIQVTGWTDATGQATVELGQPLHPGTLTLAVTAHNRIPLFRDIPVIQPDGPYLILNTVTLADASGDNDGQPDCGELVDVRATLENIGVQAATGISATLGSVDPFVQIPAPQQGFPNIPAGGTGIGSPFPVQFAGTVPDQHIAPFSLAIHANEGDWTAGFNLTAQAPVLAAGNTIVDDGAPGGNADGGADPGESFGLMVWLRNNGHAAAGSLVGTLSSAHPSVRVLDGSGDCLLVPVNDRGLMTGFRVELLPDAPNPSSVPLHLEITCASGHQAAIDFELSVGAWFDDAEIDRGWTCGTPGDNATTGLWVRADPVGTIYNGQQCQPEDDHTPAPGTVCFVTGNGSPGGTAGEQDVDGGKTTLLSPVFALGGATSAELSYWRWYTNNLGNNPNQDYWDVDVTSDGTNWVHLEHTTNSANSWTQQTFALQDFVPMTNDVRVRFVANDEGSNALLEAAVDDIILSAVLSPPTGVTPEQVRASFGIVGLHPNPLRDDATVLFRLGSATHTKLRLYDVAGRLVRSLVDADLAAGEHTITLSRAGGRALPAGMYFLRLETPEILQVRQVAIVK